MVTVTFSLSGMPMSRFGASSLSRPHEMSFSATQVTRSMTVSVSPMGRVNVWTTGRTVSPGLHMRMGTPLSSP